MLFLEGRVENRGGRGLKMEGGGGGGESRGRGRRGQIFVRKMAVLFFLKRSKQFFFERERSVLF